MRHLWLVLVAACGSDLRTHTRAFVAPAPCGQGPYDVHLVVDGKTGEEGVEIVACTAHRLVGHVEVTADAVPLTTRDFGDVADNQRCTGGTVTAVTVAGAGSGAATPGSAAPAGAGAVAGPPALVEQPYGGSETPFGDELCKPYGLPAQTIMVPTVTTTAMMRSGADLHVRIWSDAPNDLQGAIFMIRHVTSTRSLAQVQKEEREYENKHRNDPASPAPSRRDPAPYHGPPPAPLAEQPPARPAPAAVWIAGYWTWTGTAWGWSSGFWRDDAYAAPAPQVEVPGAAPAAASIWIAGSWQLEAGTWIWIHGRWR